MRTARDNVRGRDTLAELIGALAQRWVDDFCEWEAALTQADLLGCVARGLRRQLRTVRVRLEFGDLGRPARPRAGASHRNRAGGGAETVAPTDDRPNTVRAAASGSRLWTAVRGYARRLHAADGAERDAVIREFVRWADGDGPVGPDGPTTRR